MSGADTLINETTSPCKPNLVSATTFCGTDVLSPFYLNMNHLGSMVAWEHGSIGAWEHGSMGAWEHELWACTTLPVVPVTEEL